MTLSKREFVQVLSAALVARMGLSRFADADAAQAQQGLYDIVPFGKQGGDMVRVGGLQYSCDPSQTMGARISDLRLGGKPIEADKRYKVAGWAPVAEEARTAPGAKPVWEVVEAWLKAQGGRVEPRALNTPKLIGVAGNPGIVSV